MAQMMCPRCGALRNVEVTVLRRTVKDPDGRRRQVVTTSYHCEVCHTFVRSEEAET
jgi:hypothetical protein